MISLRSQSGNNPHHMASLAICTGLMLVETPVLLHALGTETYGLWMVVSALVGLLGILGFGLSEAAAQSMSEQRAQDDDTAVSQILTAELLFDLVAGVSAGAVLFLFAPNLPGLFRVSTSGYDEAVRVFRIASVGILPSLLCITFLGYLDAMMRYDLSNALRICFAVAITFGSMVVALRGGGGPGVVAWAVLISWTAVIVIASVIRRALVPGRLRLSSARSRMLSLSHSSSHAMLMSLGNLTVTYADRLVVGVLLGPVAVAYYAIAASVATKINQLAAASAQFIAPGESALGVRVERPHAYALVRRAARLSAILALGVGALMFALCDPFLRIWLGAHDAGATSAAAHWLIVAYSLCSLSAVFLIVVEAIGAPEVNAALWLMAGTATVGLILLLGPILGLNGAAIANFALTITLGANVYAIRRCGRPAVSEMRHIYGVPLIAFVLSLVWSSIAYYMLHAPLLGALGTCGLFALLLWQLEPGAIQAIRRRFSQGASTTDGAP